MRRVADIVALTIGLGVIVAVGSWVNPKPAGAATAAAVQVVNTPLPVQGSVSVANFPTTQAVSGNVAVSGSVGIDPGNNSVKDADNAARHPFAAACGHATACSITV